MKKRSVVYLYVILLVLTVAVIYLFNTVQIENFTTPQVVRHHRGISLPKKEFTMERAQLSVASSVKLPKTYNIFTANRISIDVIDQFGSGTCGACSLSTALQFHLRRNSSNRNREKPSITFMYQLSKWRVMRPTFDYNMIKTVYPNKEYNEKIKEAYNCTDTFGMYLTAFYNVMSEYRIPTETQYPFPSFNELSNGDGGTLCRIIPERFVTGSNIRNNRRLTVGTFTVNKVMAIKQNLLSNHPVIIGYQLWNSGWSADGPLCNASNPWGGYKKGSGHIPLPSPSKGDTYFGDHYSVIIGYNDNTSNFTFRNSWGRNYGNHTGDYTIPYSYITGGNSATGAYVSEFTAIRNYV